MPYITLDTGNDPLAQTLQLADLDCGALVDAEFLVEHGHTPYRIGWVLHSVFAAA